MAYLNTNIPPIECLVRGEYLRNLEDSHGTYFPCCIFGVSSIPGKVPLFHFLMEDGGIWWRMPISAFCWKECEHQELDELVLWDSFSYYVSCTQFEVLKSKKMQYISRRRNEYQGTYLFTLDWANEDGNVAPLGFSENPGQHKCGHVIKLDNGNFAIQPNNRILLNDPSFSVKRGKMLIQRKLNTHNWTVENNWKWVTEDSDNYHYEVRNEESQVQPDNSNTQPKIP